MAGSIPKVIHQTCPCKLSLPAKVQDNIHAIRELNPQWEHRLYDDADIDSIILQHYTPELFDLYSKISKQYGAARADFFRYLLMYREGGVYLDIKSSLSRPLDEVLLPDDVYILSNWDNSSEGSHAGWGLHQEIDFLECGEYQQWHIVSAPGHPFLKAVIDRVIQNIETYNVLRAGVGQLGVLRTTGPIAYTLAIDEIKEKHAHREINAMDELGFVYNIFDSTQHQELLGRHYSRCKAPIIHAGTLKERVLNALYPCLRRLMMPKS